MYRTTQTSVTVDLSSAPNFKSMGFIFCVVASQLLSDDKNFIVCDGSLETGNGERVSLGNTDAWTSIHSPSFFPTIFLYGMMKCVVCKTVNPKVTFEFFTQSGSTWKKRESNMIRGCGVSSPSYFQNLLTVL